MGLGNLNPARLPPGTRIGRWRVLERRGWGTYGAVYRAIHAAGHSAPVALKVALHLSDERFAREAELLSRIRHRSVPRLVDHGSWQQAAGATHPYLAMEWIEGVSLSEWGRVRRPTSRQVLNVLASLASALEATHAAGGVHRDVKEYNVLVRATDDQVFLIDFGSGHYVGAAPLTPPPFPPGTPPYRSPEAWRSARHPTRESTSAYAPGPADDVFALGVTAYRLVTGEYPLATAQLDDALHAWNPKGPGVHLPCAVNVRCCAELSALVSQMLAVQPEARGSPQALAEALTRAATQAGPEADLPLVAQEDFQSSDAGAGTHHAVPQASRWTRWSRFTVAGSLGSALALGAMWMLRGDSERTEQAHASKSEGVKDGGTVAVGDSALTAPSPLRRAPSAWSTIAVDLPPRPIPGQTRTDASGRCPSKTQIPINGGCWVKLDVKLKDCDPDWNYIIYKGACYGPTFPSARPSTSGPSEPPF
ncbi:serine/threonine-protein kinase [Myxococcus sp. SDU36]|uniref:serine/threonine-protein kinase n=1 Tax=Myxococcus sp. SDU36 TaxID=2831967 RepID=UPI0027A630F5|nr:serine/threonine protein kinase [Myxococcus sp. SDU36]